MNKTKKIIGISCVLIVIGFLSISYQENATSLSAFRSIFSSNRNITFTVLYIVLVPFLYNNQYSDQVSSKADRQYYVRLSYWKVQKKNIINSFSTACLTSLIVQCSLIILIHLFIAPFNFSETMTINPYFNSIVSTELASYVLLSSIGLGIYMVFCYCLIDIVKNKYIYRAVPLLYMVAQVLLYPLLLTIFNTISFPNKTIILASLIPTGLFAPGTMLEAYWLINFIASLLIYLTIIAGLLLLNKKRRTYYG